MLDVSFTITPSSYPWMEGVLAFQSVDNNIFKLGSGNGGISGSGNADVSLLFDIFGAVHVGDLVVVIGMWEVLSGLGTAEPISWSDTNGNVNTWNTGPQQFYTDSNGNTFSQQMAWSILTDVSAGYIEAISSAMTSGFQSGLQFVNAQWVWYRGTSIISLDTSGEAQGVSGDSSVTISPNSLTPTVIGSVLVDGLELSNPPGITLAYDPPFSGFLYQGGAFDISHLTQYAGWGGEYIVYPNPNPRYIIIYVPGIMTVYGVSPTCFTVGFPLTKWQDAEGRPLANGIIRARLLFDCECPCADYEVGSSKVTLMPLDVNGILIGNPQFRPNNQLKPDGSQYVIEAFSETGQLASGPFQITI